VAPAGRARQVRAGGFGPAATGGASGRPVPSIPLPIPLPTARVQLPLRRMCWNGACIPRMTMTSYLCMIDLKSDARALAFAQALDTWLALLRDAGRIQDWRLMRRKLNLAGDDFADFLLEITVQDLAQLDAAFRFLGSADAETRQRYDRMNQHIARVRYALFRPFPDPERVERLTLV